MNAPQLVRPGGVGYSLKGPGRSLAQRDVIDTVSANPDLGTFVSALQIAGLTDLLRTVDHVLIFAPTDRAFERMDSDERRALFSDRSALMRLLARHVRFDGTGEGPPGRGTPVGLYRGSAVNVVALDQSARNGVVHIIDDLIRVN